MNDEKTFRNKESLELTERKLLKINGVREIGSFNDEEVVVCFDDSELSVRGEGLHINKIDVDNGELNLQGDEIFALVYSYGTKRQEGFLSRLFKWFLIRLFIFLKKWGVPLPQNVNEQLLELAFAALLGLKLGLIFDFFRLIRNHTTRKNKKLYSLVTFVCDVLFFFFSFVFSFGFILETNMGIVRFYVLLSELFGFLLYIKTLSKIIFPFAEKLLSLIIKAFRPVFMIFIKIIHFLFIPLIIFKNYFSKLTKKCKFILKKQYIMLYNNHVGNSSSQEEK